MTRLALILVVAAMWLWDEYAAIPAILSGLLAVLLQTRQERVS
jgi:hypothetical protein